MVSEEKSDSEFIFQSKEEEYVVEYDEVLGSIELSVSVNGSCSFGESILVIFLVEYFLTVRSILLFVTLSFFFPSLLLLLFLLFTLILVALRAGRLLDLYLLLLFNRTREKSDSDELLILFYVVLYIFFLILTIFVGNDMYVPLYALSSKLIFASMSSKLVVKRLLLFIVFGKSWKDLSESVVVPTDE